MSSEDKMSDIKSIVENVFLETLEVMNESDDQPVLEKEPHRVGWPKGGRRMWQHRHSDRGTLTKIKKGMTDHEKKHMKGAYLDDTDVVHGKTGRTMGHTLHHDRGESKTYGEVRKQIQAYIAKNHPEKK